MFRSCIYRCVSSGLVVSNGYKVSRYYSSRSRPLDKNTRLLSLVGAGIGVGAIFGAGQALLNISPKPATAILPSATGGREIINEYLLKVEPTNVVPSRRVTNYADNTGLKITLYQYQTCPFCCKVRAFLDFYGISYDVVEVNPILKTQMKWSDYKKVPLVVVEDRQGKKVQLKDSSMIISSLYSFMHDQTQDLNEVANFFPSLQFTESDGKIKNEVLNRYFLMFRDDTYKGKSKEEILDERKWRQWVDDVLVHMLSPNVYRTFPESLQAFRYFSEVGEWEKNFAYWERFVAVYMGATAMFFIGKRLKKRYNLNDDVRYSLYESCNHFLEEVNNKGGKFLGGDHPSLGDLSIYGVLSSIEGCTAFQDLLHNTKLKKWYQDVQVAVKHGKGAGIVLL